MITPQQLRSASQILNEEAQRLTLEYTKEDLGKFLRPYTLPKEFFATALQGSPAAISESIRLSIAGTIEHLDVPRAKAFEARLIRRALVASIIRLIRAGLPVSIRTKDWLTACLRSQDFQEIAIRLLK